MDLEPRFLEELVRGRQENYIHPLILATDPSVDQIRDVVSRIIQGKGDVKKNVRSLFNILNCSWQEMQPFDLFPLDVLQVGASLAALMPLRDTQNHATCFDGSVFRNSLYLRVIAAFYAANCAYEDPNFLGQGSKVYNAIINRSTSEEIPPDKSQRRFRKKHGSYHEAFFRYSMPTTGILNISRQTGSALYTLKRCLKKGHTEPQLAKMIGYSNFHEIDQLAEGMAHAYLNIERR